MRPFPRLTRCRFVGTQGALGQLRWGLAPSEAPTGGVERRSVLLTSPPPAVGTTATTSERQWPSRSRARMARSAFWRSASGTSLADPRRSRANATAGARRSASFRQSSSDSARANLRPGGSAPSGSPSGAYRSCDRPRLSRRVPWIRRTGSTNSCQRIASVAMSGHIRSGRRAAAPAENGERTALEPAPNPLCTPV
jgi:hypothetical protein